MRRTLAICAAASICGIISAQNTGLNSTVRVTNEFTGTTVDADRPSMPVEVPDSLRRFNLDFDYTGFETPYRGNDEFNPFLTELLMEKRVPESRKFHLKAGAGYTLHPVFDLTWNFNPLDRVKVGVYASHKSYFGKYDTSFPDPAAVQTFNGYDAVSSAGFRARADWDKASLLADVGYDGVFAEEGICPDVCNTRGYNSGNVSLRLISNDLKGEFQWRYDLSAGYSYGIDSRRLAGAAAGPYDEHIISVGGIVGADIYDSSVELGVDVKVVSGNASARYSGWSAVLSPRYRLNKERISLGVGLSMLMNGGKGITGINGVTSGTAFWPSVDFVWKAVPGVLDLYALSEMYGGVSGLRERAMKYKFATSGSDADMTRTTRADIGLRGESGEHFRWRLGGAYNRVQNALLAAVAMYGPAADGVQRVPALCNFCDTDLEDVNAHFSATVSAGGFSLDGKVCWRHYLRPEAHPILPPSLTADLTLRYDFLSKASVYVGADYASKCVISLQNSDLSHLPAYTVPDVINLFAGAECKVGRMLSLFVEGRNLLGRSCQYVPGISEKGIAVTGGIVLNF